MIARHYQMNAAEGKADDLLAALTDLTLALETIAGFKGADLLRDVDEPARYVFIEKWSSAQAHREGAASVPKDVMASLMASLAGRPEGRYLRYVADG